MQMKLESLNCCFHPVSELRKSTQAVALNHVHGAFQIQRINFPLSAI